MRVFEVMTNDGYITNTKASVISKEFDSFLWRIDVPDAGSVQNAKFIASQMNERAVGVETAKKQTEAAAQADKEQQDREAEESARAAAPMADWENDLNERRDQGEARDEPQAESGITTTDPIVLVDGSNGDEVSTEDAPKRSTWLDPAIKSPIGGSIGDISMPTPQNEIPNQHVTNVFNNYPTSIEEDRAQTHIPNRIINGDSPLRS